MTTLDALMDAAAGPGTPEWREKMIHPLPVWPVVDREKFLLSRCKGKVVLDIGASGPMHDSIFKASEWCYGIDREDGNGITGIDLDDYHAELPVHPDVNVVVCGEVLEHLSNPGWLLTRLRRAYRCATIITVPNAHSDAGRQWLATGVEQVNGDHVAYYSWWTLKTLLGRHGYEIDEGYWYSRGRAGFTEGLIVVTG